MNTLKIRKSIFYVAGAAMIVAICMSGSLCSVGEIQYSVWNAIWKLPKETLNTNSIRRAFDAGGTGWSCILTPLIVSIPSASETMEEIQSRFYLFLEGRKGKIRYVYTRFFQNILQTGFLFSLGMGLYVIIICCNFPLNAVYSGIQVVGVTEMTIPSLAAYIATKICYLLLYHIAVSLFASWLVLLYPNLYFDLSIIFLVNYLCKDIFLQERIIYPVILIVLLFCLYGIIWKNRRE